MKKLSKDLFDQVGESIRKYARPLEKRIFKNYFYNGSRKEILDEIKKYQNQDGGFGHGIESDFRLPYSTPMATSIGVRLLSKLDDLKESQQIIRLTINYLELSFNKERNGWFVASKEINSFPHAPWWHYNEEEGMTIIDKNWGNPSAEIIAYLYKYREYVNKLDVDKLVEFAINYIENKETFNSENEIFCYIKLYEVLPKNLQERLEKRISSSITQVIVYDEKKWDEYVPKPLDFVSIPNKCRFRVEELKVRDNLDFLIEQLQAHGKINPSWGDSYYKGNLKPAYNEWIGVLTLKALMTLSEYGRIEK